MTTERTSCSTTMASHRQVDVAVFVVVQKTMARSPHLLRSLTCSHIAHHPNPTLHAQVATRCREMFGPGMGSHFKASVFQMFQQDSDGCIKARFFLSYLGQRAAMIRMRVQLGCFDPDNRGLLTEAQLEAFLEHFSRAVPSLEDMPVSGQSPYVHPPLPPCQLLISRGPLDLQEAFAPLYRRIAARKLLFFHAHNGVMRIRDLVSSQALMAELSELRIPDQTEEQLLGSWFSLQVGAYTWGAPSLQVRGDKDRRASRAVDANGLRGCSAYTQGAPSMQGRCGQRGTGHAHLLMLQCPSPALLCPLLLPVHDARSQHLPPSGQRGQRLPQPQRVQPDQWQHDDQPLPQPHI